MLPGRAIQEQLIGHPIPAGVRVGAQARSNDETNPINLTRQPWM